MTETGTIRYTERAFEQDADLAMSSDIMRALVELITNADDAYGSRDGEIQVEVTRPIDQPVTVTVRDTATGLSPDQLKSCFGVLGERQSGFHEGHHVRGMFGRGAKDTAAFGRTVFESIHEGIYGRFELARSGSWELNEEQATSEHFRRLEIPEGSSGLSATVFVEKSGVVVPRLTTLIDRLTRHVQLRRINTARTLLVSETKKNGRRESGVARWSPPMGQVLVDTEIVPPGYTGSVAVTLIKMDSPAEGRLDNYSAKGIEIRGEKATYANTLFGVSAAEGDWIHGVVECPTIDDLLRTYDEAPGSDPTNPIPIIRRDRDGLSEDHPFHTALADAVLGVLGPILADLEPKEQALGGEQLRSDLQRASQALAELLRADLDRIDEDEAPGGLLPTLTSPIIVIPPRLLLASGRTRSLTVLLRTDELPTPITLAGGSSAPAVVSVGEFSELRPHARLEGVSVSNLPITAHAEGVANIAVSAGERFTATSEVRVRDEVQPDLEPPAALQWANPSMSVMLGKQRSVELLAPAELAPDGVMHVAVTIDGDAVELVSAEVELELGRDGWLSGRCLVVGKSEGSSVRIVAAAGEHMAEGRIRVTKPGALSGMGMHITIVDQPTMNLRGKIGIEDTGFHVTVFGGHRAIRPLLGDPLPDGRFPLEQSAPARVVLCEVVASVIADWLIGREAQRFPDTFTDADAVLVDRNKLVTRYLAPLQRVLLDSLEGQ